MVSVLPALFGCKSWLLLTFPSSFARQRTSQLSSSRNKMFNVSTVFTHKILFEPMWCFQNCLLHSLHSIQFCILMSWGIDCILMKKWPRLAVIQPAVGCNVNIHILFQFAQKADNDGRALLILKTMPGNYICHQVSS